MPTPFSAADLDAILARMEEAARHAGERALVDFVLGGQTSAQIATKPGGSPVTSSDFAADAIIAAHLGLFHPEIAYHSEERPDDWATRRRAHQPVFVVDPIDGTRAYLTGRDDWCISIGLVVDGHSLAGLIHAPARKQVFSARRGGGTRLNNALLRPGEARRDPLIGSGPRTILDSLEGRAARPVASGARFAALAYRLVMPLTGAIDIAVASGGAHDWDIAAADCLLAEAGGVIRGLAGDPLSYPLDGSAHPALLAAPRKTLEALLRPVLPSRTGKGGEF